MNEIAVQPNGVREPPPDEAGALDRDVSVHTAIAQNRRDRAVGSTRCSAAAVLDYLPFLVFHAIASAFERLRC